MCSRGSHYSTCRPADIGPSSALPADIRPGSWGPRGCSPGCPWYSWRHSVEGTGEGSVALREEMNQQTVFFVNMCRQKTTLKHNILIINVWILIDTYLFYMRTINNNCGYTFLYLVRSLTLMAQWRRKALVNYMINVTSKNNTSMLLRLVYLSYFTLAQKITTTELKFQLY